MSPTLSPAASSPPWTWKDDQIFVWQVRGNPPKSPVKAWLFILALFTAPPAASLVVWPIARLSPTWAFRGVGAVLAGMAAVYGIVFLMSKFGKRHTRRWARFRRPLLGLGTLTLLLAWITLPGFPWAGEFGGAERGGEAPGLGQWIAFFYDLVIDTIGLGIPHMADWHVSAMTPAGTAASWLTAALRFLIGASIVELIWRIGSFERFTAGTVRECYQFVEEIDFVNDGTVSCIERVQPSPKPEQAVSMQIHKAYYDLAANKKPGQEMYKGDDLLLRNIWSWDDTAQACWKVQTKTKVGPIFYAYMVLMFGVLFFVAMPYGLYPLYVFLWYAFSYLLRFVTSVVNPIAGIFGQSTSAWYAAQTTDDITSLLMWTVLIVGGVMWLNEYLSKDQGKGYFVSQERQHRRQMGAILLMTFFILWASLPGSFVGKGFANGDGAPMWRWGLYMAQTLYDTVFNGIPRTLGLNLTNIEPESRQAQFMVAGLKVLLGVGALGILRGAAKQRDNEILIGTVRDAYFLCSGTLRSNALVTRVGPVTPLETPERCDAKAFLTAYASPAAEDESPHAAATRKLVKELEPYLKK